MALDAEMFSWWRNEMKKIVLGKKNAVASTLAPPSAFVRRVPVAAVRDKFQGCMLGGAVGDALGAPVEFMSREEILRQFGKQGITDMVPAYGVLGAITDDTQMMLFTAEGLLRGYVRAYLRGFCNRPGVIAYAYQRWLFTQGQIPETKVSFLDGWLITHKALFSQRAPGLTCLSALKDTEMRGQPARNNSKGCGGVMRVAPVGMMVQAVYPHSLEAPGGALLKAFDLACEAAALTHGHPTGQLASGAFAGLIYLLLDGVTLTEAVQKVLQLLSTREHHAETTNALRKAVRLAQEDGVTHDAIQALGEGWVAEEALAIGLYSALRATDFESGVVLAVNHSGDSDSTGLIAGHLLGAIHGLGAIPPRWLEPLELRDVIEEVADDVATVGQWLLDGDGDATGEADFYCSRYPGA